jgi:hypothetical protein
MTAEVADPVVLIIDRDEKDVGFFGVGGRGKQANQEQ